MGRFLDEQSATPVVAKPYKGKFLDETQPIQSGDVLDKVPNWLVSPIGKGAIRGYGKAREGIVDVATNKIPDSGPKLPPIAFMGSPISTIMPDATIKGQVKDLVGMGFDQVATLGAAKGIQALSRVPKLATSALKSASRPITRPFTAIGEEITPIARKAMFETQLGPYGINEAEAGRLTKEFGGSTGKISERIKAGLMAKQAEAREMYKKLQSGLPENFQAAPDEFVAALDKNLPDVPENTPLFNKLTRMRASRIRPTTTEEALMSGQGQSQYQPIGRDEWFQLRDELNKLYGADKNANRILEGVKGGLYKSGELSGMTDLPKAREAYRKAFFDFGDRYLNEYGQLKGVPAEGALEKVGLNVLPEEKIAELQQLEAYLGNNFIDETSKINLLRQFEEANPLSKVQSSLENAGKMGNVQARNEMSEQIGPKAPEIWNKISKANFNKNLIKFSGGAGILSSIPYLAHRWIGRKIQKHE